MHIGLDGHAMPAMRLGGALLARGHDVVAWGPERYRARVEATGVELRAFDPFEQRAPTTAAEFAQTVAEGTADAVEPLAEQLFEAEIELVLHDTQAVWGRVAGMFLGLPRLVSFPLFPSFQITAPPPPPALGPEAIARLEQTLLGLERRWGVAMGPWQIALVTAGDSTVCTTTPLVTGIDELPPEWHYVGPLMEPIPSRAADAERPLVYVALGTVNSHRTEVFTAVIEALAELPVDAVVALAYWPTRDHLDPLPPNVSVEGYVDSRELLAQATVHVTHGGASSVHESLVAGVPMVCMPLGSDNGGWAGRIAELGVGAVVEPTVPEIREAVQRLLDDPTPHRRAEEVSRELTSYDGGRRLDDVVRALLP